MTDHEEFTFSSVVHGHHVYKSTWQPVIGEQLQIQRDLGNNNHNSLSASSAHLLFLQVQGLKIFPLLFPLTDPFVIHAKVAGSWSVWMTVWIVQHLQLKNCIKASLLTCCYCQVWTLIPVCNVIWPLRIAILVMNIFICGSYSRVAPISVNSDPCGIYSRAPTIQSAAFIWGNMVYVLQISWLTCGNCSWTLMIMPS